MAAVAVSVVIPVYGGERTLAEALASVLSQNMERLEFIVLDDGSPDASWRIVKEITDGRLIFIQHPNRGLAATLNRGIQLANGRYLARQDQDDLVLPGRLTKQAEFLDAHPDVAMVGTWAQIYEGNIPAERYHRHPCSTEAIRLELLFDNPFVHSSMMIRTDILREVGGYCEDRSRQPPEDYELWSRIARKYRVANIPEVLTVYREVQGSMSRTGESPFLANVIRISSENLATTLSPEFSADECFALASLYHGRMAEDTLKNLPRARALRMHQRAASLIGGESTQWSEEFLASFNRQHAHISSQFIRSRLPCALVGPARRVKRFLTAFINRFRRGG